MNRYCINDELHAVTAAISDYVFRQFEYGADWPETTLVDFYRMLYVEDSGTEHTFLNYDFPTDTSGRSYTIYVELRPADGVEKWAVTLSVGYKAAILPAYSQVFTAEKLCEILYQYSEDDFSTVAFYAIDEESFPDGDDVLDIVCAKVKAAMADGWKPIG